MWLHIVLDHDLVGGVEHLEFLMGLVLDFIVFSVWWLPRTKEIIFLRLELHIFNISSLQKFLDLLVFRTISEQIISFRIFPIFYFLISIFESATDFGFILDLCDGVNKEILKKLNCLFVLGFEWELSYDGV